MTTTAGSDISPPLRLASLPELRAADRGVADALESVLSDNTRRVYAAHSGAFFNDWCGDRGPARPAGRIH